MKNELIQKINQIDSVTAVNAANQSPEEQAQQDKTKNKLRSSSTFYIKAKLAHKQHLKKKEYNADKIPPDFTIAERHKKACRVGSDQINISESKICECCARRYDRVQLPLCCDLKELSYLGSGYPLYFDFIKFCGILLFTLFLISGGFNIYSNYYFGKSCVNRVDMVSPEHQCELNWVTMFSIGNKKDQFNLIYIQDYLNLASLIVSMFLLQYFRQHIRKIDIESDIFDISAQDYTILVKNIPISIENAIDDDYDEDLKYFCERNIIPGQQVGIVSCTLCYNLEELNELQNQKRQQIINKAELIHKAYLKNNYSQIQDQIDIIDQKILKYKNQIEQLIFCMSEGKGRNFMENYFTGWGFVTFSNAQCRYQLFHYFFVIIDNLFQAKNEVLERYYHKDHIFQYKKKIIYHGHYLEIEPAPEPTNVDWGNLHITNQDFRMVIIYLLTIAIVVCLFFIFQSYLSYQQEWRSQMQQNSKEDLNQNIRIIGLGLSVSIIIQFFNFFILKFSKFATEFEKQKTKTLYIISSIKKTAISQAVINALFIFIIQLYLKDGDRFQKTFGSGGLIYNANWVFIGNCFIPSLVELLNVHALFRYFIRIYHISFRKCRRLPIVISQNSLNEIMEDIDFDLIFRYSTLLKNMYLCAFYAPIMPVCIIWTMLGIFLFYWVDKYNILRRRSVKYTISIQLAVEMTEMLEYYLIIFCGIASIYNIYILQIEGQEDTFFFHSLSFSYLMALIGILHAALPLQWLNKKLYSVPENPPNSLTYQEAHGLFFTDYDRENPAYSELSKKKLLTKLEIIKKQESFLNTIVYNQNNQPDVTEIIDLEKETDNNNIKQIKAPQNSKQNSQYPTQVNYNQTQNNNKNSETNNRSKVKVKSLIGQNLKQNQQADRLRPYSQFHDEYKYTEGAHEIMEEEKNMLDSPSPQLKKQNNALQKQLSSTQGPKETKIKFNIQKKPSSDEQSSVSSEEKVKSKTIQNSQQKIQNNKNLPSNQQELVKINLNDSLNKLKK